MLMAGPVPAIDVFDRRSEPIVDVAPWQKNRNRSPRAPRRSAGKGGKAEPAPKKAKKAAARPTTPGRKAEPTATSKKKPAAKTSATARPSVSKSGSENGQSDDESEDDIGGSRREFGDVPHLHRLPPSRLSPRSLSPRSRGAAFKAGRSQACCARAFRAEACGFETRCACPRERGPGEQAGRQGLRQAALLHHHGDLLSQRRAAYRPRLRGDRDRRDRALHAARRLRRLLPDRHRRARP